MNTDSTLTLSLGRRNALLAPALFVLAALWITLSSPVYPQISTATFLEFEGLVVMEAENVPRTANWQFENTEEGFAGDGYLRYVGENHFSDPGFDVLEFQILITNPGTYRMFTFMSHKGAPAPDQENDIWTKMDDGEWIKTVHGGVHIDLGFSHHTNWVFIDENGDEIFPEPEYELDAGLHTFFVSGRSWNVRLDRIHLWKDDEPFQVFYSEAAENTLPESERSNNIITIDPDPVAFSATPVGGSSPFPVDLNNEGEDAITVTDVSITGVDAAHFSDDFTGSVEVNPGGSVSLTLAFEPTTPGSKTAQVSITHTGLNSPTVANLFGSATSGGSGSTVLFRVNAGGALIEDALSDWEEDRTATEGHNVIDAELGTPNAKVNAVQNGDWTWGQNDVISLDPSVPPGTPEAIFQVGRWDPPDNPQMQWDIPVESGKEIEVRLYFAEIRFTSADDPDGPREFSVTIDGFIYSGFSGINLFEEYGHDVGVMKSTVIISDGNVDIDFVNSSNDPIVMGIEIIELGSLSRNMDAGWNLVGIPVSPSSTSYASVFDGVSLLAAPYHYENGIYSQVADVVPGVGYWINISDAGNQAFSDDSIESLTLSLNEGWNLITGPGCFIQLSDVTDAGNIIIEGTLFSYDGSYQPSSALLPGFGYWIQASSAGSITLDCASTNKGASNTSQTLDLTDFGVLEVRDSESGEQDLYFGSSLRGDVPKERFLLPPSAPQIQFDVRFNNSGWLNEGTDSILLLRGDSYPMSVTLQRLPRVLEGNLVVEELINGDSGASHTLLEGERVLIEDKNVTALRITTESSESVPVPERFSLQGNYPNPFNPTTQLVFDLPEAASVQVDVYDMLGRRVLSVSPQQLAAGAGHQILIDASSLASGTYLYHVTAEMASEKVVKLGRMTLLK